MRVRLPKRYGRGHVAKGRDRLGFKLACVDRRMTVIWDDEPTFTEMEAVNKALARTDRLRRCRSFKHR